MKGKTIQGAQIRGCYMYKAVNMHFKHVSLKVSTCFWSQPVVSPRGSFMFALAA